MNPAIPQSENALTDVITTPVKTPPKVNWNCDSPSSTGNVLFDFKIQRYLLAIHIQGLFFCSDKFFPVLIQLASKEPNTPVNLVPCAARLYHSVKISSPSRVFSLASF